ncbi:MAG: PAS domain-containing sensor histidine kinase, partial [Polaromonas sp.]
AAARQDLRQMFGLMAVIALFGLAGVGLVFGKQRRYAAGLADEIAERKLVEADLLASTARFSAMNEASPLGSFVTDGQGRCVYVNQMYQQITGYSAQDMAGASWDTGIHPADLERVRAQWQDTLGGNLSFATECRIQRADGTVTWVSCKVAAMRHETHLLGYVGTLEDISERKKVERMKNEFVSTVSHELRTPLTSIMGALGLLTGGVGGALPGQTRALVEIAGKNSARLVRLINDILDIEKIESGRMQFKLQRCELQPLVEQAIMANSAYAEQFDVSFVLVEALPGAQVMVDADGLTQVMTNLMGNAAKFSPLGGRVDLRLTREGDMIRFAVTDRGPGIPEAFRDKVFEKFSQADSSDSRQKGGTGLGLSISKAIVEAMHGRIGFVSQFGAGSTFHVDLPESMDAAPAAAVAPPAGLQRPEVLVCEDDRDIPSPL